MNGAESFKFNSQANQGFHAYEAKAVTIQPSKNPNEQPIKLVLGEGLAAATAGIVIGLVASKLIARKSMKFVPVKTRQRAQG